MDVQIHRATTPVELTFGDDGCGMCLVPFQAEAVQVLVETDDTPHAITPICPTCIKYLGRRNPERYITIEEYEELKKRYPEPVFGYEAPDELWLDFYNTGALIDREPLTTRA